MRIFAIVVLLASIVIDVRIALPYSLFSSGSGLLADTARNITNIYILSAIFQLIAVVLLIIKKGNKFLLLIATTLIGLVSYSYFTHDSVRNFVAAAGAIAIYGAIFSAYIAHINSEFEKREVRKVQLIYAVLPTLVLIFTPIIINGSEIASAYNKQKKLNEAREERSRQAHEAFEATIEAEKAYKNRKLKRYESLASGEVKGKTLTLPISDSLTIYNSHENKLTLYLLPTTLRMHEKREILGGRPLSFLQLKSPDRERWKRYPYVKVNVQFNNTNNISVDNIKYLSFHSYSIDGDGLSQSTTFNGRRDNYGITTMAISKKHGTDYLDFSVVDYDERATYSVTIDDKVHYY